MLIIKVASVVRSALKCVQQLGAPLSDVDLGSLRTLHARFAQAAVEDSPGLRREHKSPTPPMRASYVAPSRLKEAAVPRIPSAYGVPGKPNSLVNLLESNRYGASLW